MTRRKPGERRNAAGAEAVRECVLPCVRRPRPPSRRNALRTSADGNQEMSSDRDRMQRAEFSYGRDIESSVCGADDVRFSAAGATEALSTIGERCSYE